MAEIVNLRRARKAATRKAREAAAADNRVRYGTPADLKAKGAAARTKHARTLDGAKRERPDDNGDRS